MGKKGLRKMRWFEIDEADGYYDKKKKNKKWRQHSRGIKKQKYNTFDDDSYASDDI